MSTEDKKGNVKNSPPTGGAGGTEYNFRDIEKKWQQHWKETKAYKVDNDFSKPKYYVLDMFPYPSGAGLHVGHPLGYIASDIYSRYKRLKGFNVLHPMGFDSFGLPAEQYALDTGQHPAVTTKKNIETFKKQLDNIGFCYDWEREVQTSDPNYYKWTQWIFLQLFNSYFCHTEKKALPISLLIKKYETKGAMPKTGEPIPGKHFTAEQWKNFSEKEQADILMKRRLAFCGYGEVNWCEALGTVLANDEVVNGVSERGGHPVVKKKLRQWYLRITEYADRLLQGLDTVDFSDAMKEMQSNWIGKSSGAEIDFVIRGSASPHPSPGGEGASQGSEKEKFFKTADGKSWQTLKEYGRENRRNPTEAEDILWQRLRNNQLGAKVRRQHTIQGYIVDFAFLEVKLVIEVDGEYHNEAEQKIYNEARTKFLNQFGLKLLRFTNEQVIKNTENVIKEIKSCIEQQKQKPTFTDADGDTSPSLPGEGWGEAELKLKVYTTRPDTIFGVDFMVIAPEHELVEQIITEAQKQAVDEYIAYVKSRSERERMAEKKITGVFTGAYAKNLFNGREIPVWISEYVLAGYGTGAIMAVPCGDERDLKFAKHFNIPVTNIIGKHFNGEEANPTKDAILENSGFLDGMVMRDAIEVAISKIEEIGIGKRKVNYKMRDAAFSRQRYWGEPFPIVWKDGIAIPLDEKELPLELPHVDSYKPGPDGEGPLANIQEWVNQFEAQSPSPQGEGRGEAKHGALETNTMPGYAGSSWYFLRYMDPHNNETFCERKVSDYWNQVDLYIGGTEHAVGHLLYSRMWTKVLYDLNLIGFNEPYKKLVNQGMIVGNSRIINRVQLLSNDEKVIATVFISIGRDEHTKVDGLDGRGITKKVVDLYFSHISALNIEDIKQVSFSALHIDINLVDGNELDIEAYKKWKPEYADAKFFAEEDGKFFCHERIEKMSKRYYNTVNPDDLCAKYGADTFRMYEMFLGPVEMSKPWDTKGIEGVHRFLKKFWRLFMDETKGLIVTDGEPTAAELKVLHNTIKKIESDTERFSFNTGVSGFMIATNELTDLKCHKRKILEPLLILLAPYAPHIAEELYAQLRNSPSPQGEGRGEVIHAAGEVSILNATYPTFEAKYVVESSKEYPVSINGKLRTTMNISLDAAQPEVEKMVLENDIVQKWLEGKAPKKIIFVKNKMINVVV
jgi:leucyl-tRNA synthetase